MTSQAYREIELYGLSKQAYRSFAQFLGVALESPEMLSKAPQDSRSTNQIFGCIVLHIRTVLSNIYYVLALCWGLQLSGPQRTVKGSR